MLGIPFRLLREVDGELSEKTVYLRTRRSGPAGKAMQEAKRHYHRHSFAAAKAAQRYASADRRIRELPPDHERIDSLEERRDAALDAIEEHSGKARDAAAKLVELALRENYQGETDDIMDLLLDSDMDALVEAIETGELPQDFFAGGGRPPAEISTLPSGGEPPACLSPADTPCGTSSEGE